MQHLDNIVVFLDAYMTRKPCNFLFAMKIVFLLLPKNTCAAFEIADNWYIDAQIRDHWWKLLVQIIGTTISTIPSRFITCRIIWRSFLIIFHGFQEVIGITVAMWQLRSSKRSSVHCNVHDDYISLVLTCFLVHLVIFTCRPLHLLAIWEWKLLSANLSCVFENILALTASRLCMTTNWGRISDSWLAGYLEHLRWRFNIRWIFKKIPRFLVFIFEK